MAKLDWLWETLLCYGSCQRSASNWAKFGMQPVYNVYYTFNCRKTLISFTKIYFSCSIHQMHNEFSLLQYPWNMSLVLLSWAKIIGIYWLICLSPILQCIVKKNSHHYNPSYHPGSVSLVERVVGGSSAAVCIESMKTSWVHLTGLMGNRRWINRNCVCTMLC